MTAIVFAAIGAIIVAGVVIGIARRGKNAPSPHSSGGDGGITFADMGSDSCGSDGGSCD